MTRKICVVTGTRADFGLLRKLMQEIEASSSLVLQIVATGMHLSHEHGLTYREIENAGLNIDMRVEMLLSSDTPVATSKSVGMGLIGFADAFERLRPDIVLVLGDRVEILAAASAALIAGIPLSHVHGGESTEGAIDEAIRHSITKMSHLHLVAAEDYRRRVIQLGENPDTVFNVGGLGVDALHDMKFMTKEEVESSLGLSFGNRSVLVTFHPITLEGGASSVEQVSELLSALHVLEDTTIILTMPNSDAGGREISDMFSQFTLAHPNAMAFTSLGSLRYLSCMKWVNGVVGNSSSGLAEAPSLKVGTINIGDRQKGRLQASSVINCQSQKSDILAAFDELFSEDFERRLTDAKNPYGEGGASKAIVGILERYDIENVLKKRFYDLEIPNVVSC